MKTIILSLLLFVSLNAQTHQLLTLMSDEGATEWKPTDVDANTLAYYDGNIGLTATSWEDQLGDNDILFTNAPTVVAGATPSRNAIRFNGNDEYGIVATPTKTQPYTIYIVYKPLRWSFADYIFDDGNTTSNGVLYQSGTEPWLTLYAGTNIVPEQGINVNSYGISTCVFNGASSGIRKNLLDIVSGNAGTNNGSGINIGGGTAHLVANAWNGEIAYLIIRSGADDTATQNIIINNLAALCGLTL